MNLRWWSGKRVFLTGHTGFKGSWCGLWLMRLGAAVHGYALAPASQPNLFDQLGLAAQMPSTIADIRDRERLARDMRASQAEIVLHMAAQSLVHEGYERPVLTYDVNIAGTANVIDAMRGCPSVHCAVIVTSDKCYKLGAPDERYAESAPLGGRDPYSASKAGAELVTAALRAALFEPDAKTAAIATARAGNVIGGGDRARDRLVPDLVSAFESGGTPRIRRPDAIRPWQYVLEPTRGYLELARRMFENRALARPWNFGPPASHERPVRWIAENLAARWGEGARWETARPEIQPAVAENYEAPALRLDSSAAARELEWTARLDLDTALDWVVEWHKRTHSGEPVRAVTLDQIERYQELAA